MNGNETIRKGRELTLREVQLVSTELCKTVDRICGAEGLRYYLFAGSLLGAVRHHGFIPWDDDIDIVMPRPDYEKLIAYLKEHEEELKPLRVYNMKYDPDYPYMISRLSDERYVLEVENEEPYGIGVFMDIYPWDGVGQTEEEMRKRKGKAEKYSSLCYLSTRKKCIRENTTSKLKRFLKPFAHLFAKAVGKNRFAKKLNEMASKYGYDESKYVGCLIWGGASGVKGIWPREWMEPYVKLPFEDAEFRAPKEWDRALTWHFGNYMELPAEKDRVPHHNYKAFVREEK